MSNITLSIDSILGGEQASEFYGQKGQFLSSIGINPDFPKDDSSRQASGFLRPTAMAKFSGSTVTGVPLWIIPNPKDTNIYVYANDGKLHSVSSSLSMNSNPTAPTSASGNGAEYYDNYLYLAKNTDIARYGPLDGTPSLTQSYWVGSLGKTALTNTTYPSIRGIAIPNHPMHRHTDNKLYIGDVSAASATGGNKGVLHFIRTKKASSIEGNTNDGSNANAVSFPYGYYPTAIESYGSDLAVALIEGTNTTLKQKRAKVSFWDTTSTTYNKITDVEFPDPLITALKNVNGVLYVWSGNASGGVRLSRFIGGYSFEEVLYLEEGVPPFQGAVDAEMNRLIWGAYMTDPESFAVVKAYGSKMKALGTGTFTPFTATSATTTNQIVTAVKFVEQANNSRLRPIIGWADNSAKGLDSISTTYGVSRWDSSVFRIGRPFIIKKVRIPLAQAVAANMTLIPTIYVDEASSSTALTTINSTNYPNSERNVVLYPDVSGKHNFYLSLRWSGTALLTVSLPITIEVELLND
jgi:hypothetical protein